MTSFDRYISVDWSARSLPSPARPSRDALWLAERGVDGEGEWEGEGTASRYVRTRAECVAELRARLREHVARGRRVLVGWDFALGYPRGLAAALGLSGDAPAWRLLWDELGRLIVDQPDNGNNRFAVAAALNARIGGGPGPFWGCPPSAAAETLQPRSPGFPYAGLARLRAADRLLAVQPVWKLFGAGSVGGQTLLGIPAVRALRDDPALETLSRVWPCETGFSDNPVAAAPAILHVELWPGIAGDALDPTLIRDEAQVRAAVAWLAAHDAAGSLGSLLAGPPGLPREDRAAAVAEEAWILGAGEPAPD